jgi:glycosyltransferase involved in cell wall biosynthesis
VTVPTVSVIIPVYNARGFLRPTVESVLAQTWRDRELVVVDDGSTDGSEDAVRDYRGRLRYIRQENGGVAKARNRGIAESTGRYVALLDHDDLWHSTKLEKQIDVLERRPDIGMVITDVAHIDREGRDLGIVGAGYRPSERFARLFVRGYVPTPSAAVIRRSVLEHVGGFDEAFQSAGLDDHELWTRIAEHYDISSINEPLTYHRNLTIKPAHIALEHRVLLFSKLMTRFSDDVEKRKYLLEERAMQLADQGKERIKRGERRQGRFDLLHGLGLSLGEARSLKTAWRCLTRIVRSYV